MRHPPGMGGPHQSAASLLALPTGYHDQRKAVIQLLKDAYHPYSLSSPARADGTPRNRSQEGYSNLNKTVTERWNLHDRYMASHAQLRDRLERMQQLHPLYYALEKVFLHDEASDRAYEELAEKAKPAIAAIHARLKKIQKKARRGDDVRGQQLKAWRDGMTEALRLYTDVELAIHDLTLNMMELDLYVHDPWKKNPELENAKPKITIEERYAEINRIFEGYCNDFKSQRPGKPYRNRAYRNTVVATNESLSTVERAVRHCSKDAPNEEPEQEPKEETA